MSAFRTIVPPIKCQGIKTKLVPWIKSIVPAESKGLWVEPFMGSGVVAFNVRPRRALLADTNPHLINFYTAIRDGEITPSIAKGFLEKEGAMLLASGGEHFYTVRKRFNENGAPLDFLFLNRACFNGMIRFNRKGGFNVPFCRKPNRFAQAYITKITNQIQAVSDAMKIGEYDFVCQSFAETIAEAGSQDWIYCDPPYIERHADYFNGWIEEHENELEKSLAATPAKVILSTWHSNDYRTNTFIESLWSDYHMLTREHFYHVGAKEVNRNPMLEALLTNFKTQIPVPMDKEPVQLQLLEEAKKYKA